MILATIFDVRSILSFGGNMLLGFISWEGFKAGIIAAGWLGTFFSIIAGFLIMCYWAWKLYYCIKNPEKVFKD